MAHWAKVEDGIVTQVLVGSNDHPDEGYQWLIDNIGGTWVKTSYNTYAGVHTQGGTPLRKNYAGIGFTYDAEKDAFIPPKPDDYVDSLGRTRTFTLNEETCVWVLVDPKDLVDPLV